jgi:hypothetical protein
MDSSLVTIKKSKHQSFNDKDLKYRISVRNLEIYGTLTSPILHNNVIYFPFEIIAADHIEINDYGFLTTKDVQNTTLIADTIIMTGQEPKIESG